MLWFVKVPVESKTQTPWADRVHSGAAGRRARLECTPTGFSAQDTPQGFEDNSSEHLFESMNKELVESKTRTQYGPVGSGRRTAGPREGAGPGRTGRRRVDPARRQPSLLPSGESKTLSWTPLRKHEQTKSYVNRWRNEISG